MLAFIGENWEALAGLAATAVGGLWTVFVYASARGRAADAPETRKGGGAPLPWAALALACGGLALAALAISRQGDTTTADRSIVARDIQTQGDIINNAQTTVAAPGLE